MRGKVIVLVVNIEETSKSGTGVAKIRGFVVLVNNTNPGERVKIRIKQVAIMQWLTSLVVNNLAN